MCELCRRKSALSDDEVFFLLLVVEGQRVPAGPRLFPVCSWIRKLLSFALIDPTCAQWRYNEDAGGENGTTSPHCTAWAAPCWRSPPLTSRD